METFKSVLARYKKCLSIFLFLLIFFVFVGIIANELNSNDIDITVNISKVCFDGSCISVEIPRGMDEMARGLMFREKLNEDEGMLFIFQCEDKYPFWMKNMKFPIDIIWMDSNGRVVHIERSVPPCKREPCIIYKPKVKAKYVLEVVANFTIKQNITLNSNAVFY